MATILYALYALTSLILAVWGILQFSENPALSIALLVCILIGMAYDSSIIAIGSFIDEGGLLKFLNQLRHLIHSLFVPLLIVATTELARAAGVSWANHLLIGWGTWLLTLTMMAIGVARNVLSSQLIPIKFAGTLTYKRENASHLPANLTTLIVAIAGIYIWLQSSWPWMFVGTLLVFCGNALPTRKFGALISSASEMVFMLALLATQFVFPLV
jgi:hypothetical protein